MVGAGGRRLRRRDAALCAALTGLGPDCRAELRREEKHRRKTATERAAARVTREGMEAPADLALFEVLRADRIALRLSLTVSRERAARQPMHART